MILTLQNLKQFIYSIKDRNINYLKIQNDQLKIYINTDKKTNYIVSNYLNDNNLLKEQYKQNSNIETFTKSNKNQILENSKNNNNESETYSTIISPMVGTFYRSPAPNEPAFIEKNDIVQKKQTVCIIEAMKLMNEIESEVHGEIIDILVNDGDIVDCGQALIKVKTM
uniref:Biotin carboxyl carrier protein of acetyl-CoA carboxylase n=1 Tax=Dipterocladia arabiensis TaxID=2007176 RepID=A0A1Z1M0X6_9FLOR|nr:acetyl-CoA carboxylase biotin carboxyl carrier protein [Dipterocladia arabiensis]ARW59413.1 acetyl-CoA carboxylase biotin carboxyl carrier protein [Dipterocladia arabiensis]